MAPSTRTDRREDAVDALLAVLAAVLHVAATVLVDRWPPGRPLEHLLFSLPPLAALLAAALVGLRGDRRGVQVAAVLLGVLVVLTLPAYLLGLAHVPATAVLAFAALRPRRTAAGG